MVLFKQTTELFRLDQHKYYEYQYISLYLLDAASADKDTIQRTVRLRYDRRSTKQTVHHVTPLLRVQDSSSIAPGAHVAGSRFKQTFLNMIVPKSYLVVLTTCLLAAVYATSSKSPAAGSDTLQTRIPPSDKKLPTPRLAWWEGAPGAKASRELVGYVVRVSALQDLQHNSSSFCLYHYTRSFL